MTRKEWVARYKAYCVGRGYAEAEARIAASVAWNADGERDEDELPEDRAAQDLELIG